MSCPACFTGSQHTHGEPKGEMTMVHGLECYVTPPLSEILKSDSRIVYMCDAIGLPLVNNKLLADEYAKGTGIRVYAPPFPTKPAAPATLAAMDVAMGTVGMTDIGGQLRRAYNVFLTVGAMVPFLLNNKPASVFPDVVEFVRKIKSDMAGSDGKLGVAGFCWGGYHAVNLCTQTNTTDPDSGRLVDAQFTAHPSALSGSSMLVDAVATHAVPCSIAYPNNDLALSRKAVDEAVATLNKLQAEDPERIEYELRIYEGQAHGFAVRGDLQDEEVKKAVQESTNQAVDWFRRFL
ncbi:hypothetical protein LTR64_008705 [Lithohypha guttulata]|uniref:uncharacterized protein n=1 Tax=Lithohypha guttulata TaxID=1690604 RepID=UPI002DDF1427|nr:hypothetical protein LTR51_008688 [Lithohypha guttulata]